MTQRIEVGSPVRIKDGRLGTVAGLKEDGIKTWALVIIDDDPDTEGTFVDVLELELMP